jgi:DNA repair photolyase
MFVRWDNLTVEGEEQRRLPGYRDEAVVRRFDAPEALETRFYEVRARSILNRVPEQSRMPFRWTINPYRGCSHACHYCFARPTHTYLGFNAGRDFEREIVVKINAPELARAELARRSWKREHVALGTNTDPYQWVEGRYRLMEGIWEAMRDAGNPCSVLTKSPLLLRDLELMREIAQRTSFTACLSIPTLDEKAWRASEPHTPNPRARLEAVAELNRAGIPTGVLVAPLMPGINDAPEQVEPLLQAAEAAGATSVSGVALHLRGEVRAVFMEWLATERPDLVQRYRELYRRGGDAPHALPSSSAAGPEIASATRRAPRGERPQKPLSPSRARIARQSRAACFRRRPIPRALGCCVHRREPVRRRRARRSRRSGCPSATRTRSSRGRRRGGGSPPRRAAPSRSSPRRRRGRS